MGKKKPVGRPLTTTSDFPKGWQKEVINLGEQGASDVEFRDYLNCICHRTWDRLLKEDEEFCETIKRARSKCELWWQKQGRLNLENKEFSATLWYMNMKNRFKWADKQEINHQNDGGKFDVIERVIVQAKKEG